MSQIEEYDRRTPLRDSGHEAGQVDDERLQDDVSVGGGLADGRDRSSIRLERDEGQRRCGHFFTMYVCSRYPISTLVVVASSDSLRDRMARSIVACVSRRYFSTRATWWSTMKVSDETF